jgi:vacuolar-type H+-ATPase subunit H
MSDILDKLLGVEKSASALTTEAESEATHRKTQARLDAQKEYSRMLGEKAKEQERRLEDEREHLKKERESKNGAYTEGLRALALSVKDLRRAVFAYIRSDR